MNFFTVQNINTYTKHMEMSMKWQKKKSSNDFTADGSSKIDDSVRKQAEEIRKSKADGSDKLSKQIDIKLNNGQKLTAEEMEYLRKKDPQMYQKVKSIEAEQANYENELKRCQTKEEAQRVRMAHTAASLNAVNSIKNNPVIPEDKKLELIMHEHRKNMAFEESTREYVESGKYAKLPTEAEKTKAEKDLEEAKKEELGIEKPAEEKETLDTEISEEAETVRTSDGGERLLAERKLTRMEAESTPEAMKVKRARAQAAYKSNQPELILSQMLDVKVE